MADSNIAIAKLLKVEGGLLKDADGVTKFGICSKYATGVDVEHLTSEQAEDWYYNNFWLKMRLFLIDDQAVAEQLLDAGVNCGRGTAVRIVQRAYNLLYPAHPLVVDGVMGPFTAMALNDIKPAHKPGLMNAIRHQRVQYYLETLAAHPEKERYRIGWMNRI